DRDGYGRTVADVILPDSRVLNRELGAAGLAWWYRQYSKDESLGKLAAEARATRRGLWADRDPSRPGAGGSGRRGGSAEGQSDASDASRSRRLCTEAIMAMIWTDLSGKKYELKQDKGEWWYRVQGEGDDKWKK